MEIPLPSHLITTGTVQTWQLRAMDWIGRKATFVEKVPAHLAPPHVEFAFMCHAVTKIQVN
jgi:hypothetical protein